MNIHFCDTSYFLALLIPSDENHSKAVALASRLHDPLVTTDWILVEVANFLAPRHVRSLFSSFVELMQADPRATIILASKTLLREGIALYKSRPDKDWSLTDCISFIVMRQQGLTDTLTADHHFEQAGLNVLMK